MEHLEHPDKGRTGSRENHEIQVISCRCRMSGYPNLRFSGEKVGHSFFPLPHYFKINVRFDSETGSASDPDPCQTWWEGSVSLTARRGLFWSSCSGGKGMRPKSLAWPLLLPATGHQVSAPAPGPCGCGQRHQHPSWLSSVLWKSQPEDALWQVVMGRCFPEFL